MDTTSDFVFAFMKLLGSLALLMYGMKLMSETLQKMAGPQLRHVLGAMTSNRLTGLLTGIGVTAAVQSSTATTVMTVSFVNAGLLSLAQAISVIMGANIGTTLTAWIISAGATFNITDYVYPSLFVAIILIYSKRRRNAGDLLFGVAFLLLGLGTLRQTGVDMDLGNRPEVLRFFASFDPDSPLTTLAFLLLGGVMTMCVQSSAAVMAITMLLCSSGALPIYQGIALVMGENIGTTVTSNIAAYTANTQARRAAFAHMFFNIFGVCWMLLVFRPFVDMVCNMAGYDVDMTRSSVSQAAFLTNAARLNFVLAAFHTCFNLANTGVLIWFVPQIERFVCRVIKPKRGEEEEDSRLHYIQRGLMPTPEIAVLQAQKETILFAQRMQRMFGMVRQLVEEADEEAFQKCYERIEKYEGIGDNMEIEIAQYLEQVGNAHLSDETKAKSRAMIREIGELESIGDACFNMARVLLRRHQSDEQFTEGQSKSLSEIMQLAGESLSLMLNVLVQHKEDVSLQPSVDLENKINSLRNQLKADNIQAVNEHRYTYAAGTMYMDLVNECERLADYVMNVIEARLQINHHVSPSHPEESLSFEGLQLDLDRKTAVADGEPLQLTRTEFLLLSLLLSERGKVFSRHQVIQQVWPNNVIVTNRTVDTNIARLRKKIGRYARCVVARPGFGYCFDADQLEKTD